MKSRWVSIGVSLALAIGLYEFLRLIHPAWHDLLPSTSAILEETFASRTLLMRASLETLTSVFVSLALTLPGAIAVGFLMRTYPPVEDALLPFLIAVKSLPSVAFVPVLMVLVPDPGYIRILLTISICFLPMTLAAYDGLRAAPSALRYVVLLAQAPPSRMFLQLTLPAAANHLLLGLKITLPLAFLGTLVAEISAGQTGGIGNVIRVASTRASLELPMAAVLTAALVSCGMYLLLLAVVRSLYPASKKEWL